MDSIYRAQELPMVDSDFGERLRELPAPLYGLMQLVLFEGLNTITANHSPPPANTKMVLVQYVVAGGDVYTPFSLSIQPTGIEAFNFTQAKQVGLPVKDRSRIRVMIWLEDTPIRLLEKSIAADQVVLEAMFACVPDVQKVLATPSDLSTRGKLKKLFRFS